MRRLVLAVSMTFCWIAGTALAADKESPKTAPFVHVVIFQLKKDAPADAAEGLITDAHEMLAKIPTVRGIQAGKPAPSSGGGLAKSDYQVGLLVLFDNAEDLAAYAKHPLHLKYVEKHLKNLDPTKLAIYDFVGPKK